MGIQEKFRDEVLEREDLKEFELNQLREKLKHKEQQYNDLLKRYEEKKLQIKKQKDQFMYYFLFIVLMCNKFVIFIIYETNLIS